MDTSLASTLESVDQAEALVFRIARDMGFPEDALHELCIAVRESMVNAVAHGNRYNLKKQVGLVIAGEPDHIAIRITDEGNGFDLADLPDPTAEENLLRQSGRGLLMIRAFVDEFEIRKQDPRGTQVRLVKYLNRKP